MPLATPTSTPPFEIPEDSLIRLHGRPVETAAFEKALTSYFIQAADLIGAPHSMAAIYAVLFSSPVPLCFADLSNRLMISAGSISHGLRVLKEIGAIHSVGYQGDRKEYFEADMELKKMFRRFLEGRLAAELAQGEQRLENIRMAIPKLNDHDAKVLEARVDQLAHWQSKAKALIPVAKSFLAIV